MKHNIFVKNKDKSRQCFEDKNLMDSLSKQADLAPKGCHNGACGLCKIHILSGEYEKIKMNRKHVSEIEENSNIVLACRIFPRGDMEIEFLSRPVLEQEKKIYVFGS